MAKRTTPSKDKLNQAMAEALRLFGHRENLTAVDIGYVWHEDKRTDDVAVRIHVSHKIPETELESSIVFPSSILGVPVDVIEGNYRIPEAAPLPSSAHQTRLPFVMAGMSCGRRGGGTGTIGAIVKDRISGRPGILSNWHVLAGAYARPGDPILHPGELDGGYGTADEVANLGRWMLDSDGDAAMAFLNPGTSWLPLQIGLFTEINGTRQPKLGEVLAKSGRTTGVTHARVDGYGIYRLRYEVRPGQLETRDISGFKLVAVDHGNPDDLELSAAGDSGSFWVDPDRKEAVGLHFAGETSHHPSDEHAIACMVNTVLDRLDVEPAKFEDVYAAAEAASADLQRAYGFAPTFGPTPFPIPYPQPRPWPIPAPAPIPPVGPLPGPYPGPYPRPYPWPWESFNPYSGPSDTSSGYGSVAAYPVPAGPQLEYTPSVYVQGTLKVWAELQEAMDLFVEPDRISQLYSIGNPVSKLTLGGRPAATLARMINQKRVFEYLPRKILESDIDPNKTFFDVCKFLEAFKTGGQ